MVEVVLITRQQPAATFLINKLQDVHPLREVIFERWTKAAPAPSVSGLRRRAAYYRQRLKDQLEGSRSRELDAARTVFGGRHLAIEKPTTTKEIDDRDWKTAAAMLGAAPPDVILVFGNSLLPDEVTRAARITALNIHTGLSPHYRGQNCTPFAILNEDLENIGVTIHVVRKQIDGGEIIAQRRPTIVAGDDESVLNAKNQRAGAELYCEILGKLKSGEAPRPVGQPKDVGLLLMNRAYTPEHARLVRHLIEGGAVERYLERKAAQKTRPKPIISELQMGSNA